jgi:hypothetical protein
MIDNKMLRALILILILSSFCSCARSTVDSHTPISTGIPSLTSSHTPDITEEFTITPSPTQPFTMLRDAGYNGNLIAYNIWALASAPNPSFDIEFPSDLGVLYLRTYEGINYSGFGTDFGSVSGFHWSPLGDWLLVEDYAGSGVDQDGDLKEDPAFSLWILKPGDSEMRNLFLTPQEYHLDWDIARGMIIANCVIDADLYHICITSLEDEDVIHSGNIGYDPKFSPDGVYYGWHDRRTLWMADLQTHQPKELFSVSKGSLLGFDWDVDSSSIITGVLIKGRNNCEGSFTFYRVYLDDSEPVELAVIPRYLHGWSMSPDRLHLLSRSVMCVGNAYDLPILLSIDGEGMLWPLAKDVWADYSWSPNGQYIVEYDHFGNIFLISVRDGESFHVDSPAWMDDVLLDYSYSESYSLQVEWKPQP